MKTFWQDLAIKKRPFFVLAPMDGATDSIFRRIVSVTGRPDAFFTEFTNVEGLFSKGAKAVERRLRHTNQEYPLIAQIWGLNAEFYYKTAKLLNNLKFDGIDINMGCPETSVTKRGACSGLINNRPLAKEIIEAVKSGAGDLPISIKTRIGFSTIVTDDWAEFLLNQDLDALIVHGRTRKEMSKVPVHWEEIYKVVKLRNKMKKKTVIIGNGDVKSINEGIEKYEKYGLDGIMIGRGVFENAWVFKKDFDHTLVSPKDRIKLLKMHLNFYDEEEEPKLPYHTLKKYFKIYIRDFDGASLIREKLMETNNTTQARQIIDSVNITTALII